MRVRIRANVAFLWAASLYAIVPGEPAPDVLVRDSAGTQAKLSAFRDKSNVALLVAPEGRVATLSKETERKLALLDTVVAFQPGPAATVFLDKTGTVRRVVEGRNLIGPDLENFVGEWHSGKGAFAAWCARCHGDDGEAVWCDPKPLTGIGRRMSAQQVRDTLKLVELDDEVIIRGERIKKADIDPIIVYVRSL